MGPYTRCTKPECVVDEECPQVLACRNEKCVDPCNCAVNANCIVRSHRARCQCYEGYQGDPYNTGCFPIPEPKPECTVDADCPSRLACLNEVCRNPSTTLTPCGQNAECTVQNTLPQRTMVCMCIPGYVGDADIACNLPPRPEPGCKSNSECGDREICRDRNCINPCIVANPCATNAVCDVRQHSVTCNCPSGFTGDPFSNCYAIEPRPECTADPDCPQDQACINENCLNPCLNSERPCGRGAECLVEFHQARCVCSAGLQGNPLVACINVECRTDNDCRQDQACDFISQTCGPVCGSDPCTRDATCRGVNHQ